MKSNKNNISNVPKFEFSNDIVTQKLQLESNELIVRFSESRNNSHQDPYRPNYHFVSPESTMNDPNGLCYWNGMWHLFYQAYPPEDPRQHWGHAVSENLIHWKDLPYAIYPSPEKACFSGSTLVEENRVIAMYHGTEEGNMIATSSDPLLLQWEKITEKAVIPISKSGEPTLPYSVFDPCIWKDEGVYYALSGGTLPHKTSGRRKRANFLFESKDLKSWKYLHPFIEGDQFTIIGDDGACPYFWPIGNRHILLFFSHMSGGQSLIGDYNKNERRFSVTSHHKFNFGSAFPGGVHAPSATPDGKGGIVTIFNMNSAKKTKVERVNPASWDQIMTLPRRISILGNNNIEKDMIKIEPAGDIESLRYNPISKNDIILPANEEICFDEINGNCLEIIAQIDINSAPMIELNVLKSPRKEEFTRVCFFANRGYRNWERYDNWDTQKRMDASDGIISIDSSQSSLSPDTLSRPPESAPVYLEPKEDLELRVFIDKSVLEVFVNNKQCIAMRIYPSRKDSTGISFKSQGETSKILSLTSWKMRSIY